MLNGALRIGVPPGVGDVYFALTKLKAFRDWHGASRVRLVIQHSSFDRSRAWAGMVDFVDEATVGTFSAPRDPKGIGKVPGLDFILWPNAVIDRGESLAAWMPELPLDLSFPVRTESMGEERRVVIYPSSIAMNRAWLPTVAPDFWPRVIAHLSAMFGRVTVIGATWDVDLRDKVLREAKGNIEFLIGKTTLPQVADILKRARVVVGLISGMTILANHFRTPCVALYADRHHPRFPYTWVSDDAPYRAMRASAVPPADELASIVKGMAA